MNVYDQLRSEGYIIAQAGNGTFAANHLPHLCFAAIHILENHQPPPAAAPFQSYFLDQTLFSHRIWARHRECAWRAPTAGVLALPNPFGWYPLRGAIANHLSAWRGLNCRPEQVLITSGAWESLTHSMFGAGARNFRFTLSFGHRWPLSGTVVFFTFPRITPWIARRFINLATVQRAIVHFSRCN